MARFIFALALALALSGTAGSSAGAASKGPRYVPGEVLVQYRTDATTAQQSAVRGNVGIAAERIRSAGAGKGKLELVKLRGGRSVESAIRALQSNPAVAYAEPNWIYTHDATSNDPYYTNGSLWGMYGDASAPSNQYGSQAAEAWSAGRTGSKDVYVGIIDEGIDYNHPDLAANIWKNPYDPVDGRDNDGNGYVDDTRGWDFANNDNSIYDGRRRDTSTDSHGTHVAGAIGGVGGNGQGVAGVNWNVTMISGKFLGRYGGSTAGAIKAVDYFTDLKRRHGLNIVATNNSWGGGGYSQALADAIARANNAGILFIAAAGNGGSDGIGDNNDVVANYPSNYNSPNVLAVAAIDKAGALARFSNYGATTVDIGAPGVGVYSTTPKGTYSSYNGTSMATPHVSGAAALYASTRPGATAAEIKNAILDSGAPTGSLTGKTVTGDRLNAGGF
jgi:subtilisin family serine protease